MELANLRPLTWIVTVMVVFEAFPMPFTAFTVQLFPDFFMANIMPFATAYDRAILLYTILTMIVFSTWIYLAGRNLVRAGYDDLEFTPGARIWWFAVPVANLFKPFQGMRELWNASHGEQEYTITPPLIATWWAFWLASRILGMLVNSLPNVNMMALAGAADIGLAIVAILMIHRVAEAQRRLSPAEFAEVFA